MKDTTVLYYKQIDIQPSEVEFTHEDNNGFNRSRYYVNPTNASLKRLHSVAYSNCYTCIPMNANQDVYMIFRKG